jgi:hypothetical protein
LSEQKRFPGYGWIGLAVLITAQLLLFLRVEIVGYWFFPLAWWPYILIADGLVRRRKGGALLSDHPREFALLSACSVCLWLVFELFNVTLNNWHYVLVPQNHLLRWGGYALCYATVLPGLFETMALLDGYGFLSRSRTRPISTSTRWYAPFVITGAIFLVLPLVWPQYFFPLVWGCFIFLLEPLNHRLGVRSLMREWEQGSLRTFYLLLIAGGICGLLWEFWNFWALTKWVYTVPYVGWLKVFEMPILGFLGFPPFAVQCYVIMNTVSILRQGRGWQDPSMPITRSRPGLNILVVFILVIFCLFVFRQIDIHTVATWRP